MKPRVMSLVLFTCMVGMIISLSPVSLANSIISLLAVAMGSGAAGALNMWYESDLDAIMAEHALNQYQLEKLKKTSTILWYDFICFIYRDTLLFF